jgi:hypothetical protein
MYEQLSNANLGPFGNEMARLTWVVGLCLLLLNCSPGEESEARSWLGPSDSLAIRTLLVPGSICLDCIQVARVALLGDTIGPGYLEYSEDVVVDEEGRFWVGQQGHIKVFDSEGAFLEQVGSMGEGPMEFFHAAPFHVDPYGTVHVFDRRKPRITRIRSDFSLDGTATLRAIPIAIVPLPQGRYCANAVSPTTEGIGHPLHTIHGEEITHSFGQEMGDGPKPVRGLELLRLVATDDQGRIYSARNHSYSLDVWSAEGRRITGFKGPLLNEQEPMPGPMTRNNPPLNKLLNIHVDESGFLWVVSLRSKPDWMDFAEEVVAPDGRIVLQPRDGNAFSLAYGRIDVVDLRSGQVLARSEEDEVFHAFLNNGWLLSYQLNEAGVPQLEVASVRFHDPRER